MSECDLQEHACAACMGDGNEELSVGTPWDVPVPVCSRCGGTGVEPDIASRR